MARQKQEEHNKRGVGEEMITVRRKIVKEKQERAAEEENDTIIWEEGKNLETKKGNYDREEK
jgi:hypothetical protein